MPEVSVNPPGETRSDGKFPSEVQWTFHATVDGREGMVSGWFAVGVSEADAASALAQTLASDPSALFSTADAAGAYATGGASSGGAAATGPSGGSGGSAASSAAGSGVGSTVGGGHEHEKIHVMKTSEGDGGIVEP